MSFRVPRFLVVAGSGLLLSLSFAACAQSSVGIRAGANVASMARPVPAGQPKAEVTPLLGAQVGVVLNVRVGKLAFQPGLLFSQKGYAAGSLGGVAPTTYAVGDTLVRRGVEVTRKGRDYLRLNYLEMPLNVVYTFGETGGAQLIFGTYVGMGLNGRIHTDGFTVTEHLTKTVGGQLVADQTRPLSEAGASDIPVTFSTNFVYQQRPYLQCLDVGLTGGLGFATGPVQVQALYGWGIANLAESRNGLGTA